MPYSDGILPRAETKVAGVPIAGDFEVVAPAAFALGAEGIQMGTRMVSAAESPVHEAWKQAVIEAAETDTVVLNRFGRPGIPGMCARDERSRLSRRG